MSVVIYGEDGSILNAREPVRIGRGRIVERTTKHVRVELDPEGFVAGYFGIRELWLPVEALHEETTEDEIVVMNAYARSQGWMIE